MVGTYWKGRESSSFQNGFEPQAAVVLCVASPNATSIYGDTKFNSLCVCVCVCGWGGVECVLNVHSGTHIHTHSSLMTFLPTSCWKPVAPISPPPPPPPSIWVGPPWAVAERVAARECGGREAEAARGPMGREREERWVAENGLLLPRLCREYIGI